MKVKQTAQRLLVSLMLAVGLLVGIAQPALAVTECGGVETSIIGCKEDGLAECADGSKVSPGEQCADGSTPDAVEGTGIWGILLIAINILTAGVGLAAVAGLVFASILYTSAGGNQEQTKKAMGYITNIVIGIIAYALMFSGLNFLIPGGLFN